MASWESEMGALGVGMVDQYVVWMTTKVDAG